MSWEQLLAIYADQAQNERDYERLPPTACPNDGTPLDNVNGELHCRHDGWIWDGQPIVFR